MRRLFDLCCVPLRFPGYNGHSGVIDAVRPVRAVGRTGAKEHTRIISHGRVLVRIAVNLRLPGLLCIPGDILRSGCRLTDGSDERRLAQVRLDGARFVRVTVICFCAAILFGPRCHRLDDSLPAAGCLKIPGHVVGREHAGLHVLAGEVKRLGRKDGLRAAGEDDRAMGGQLPQGCHRQKRDLAHLFLLAGGDRAAHGRHDGA